MKRKLTENTRDERIRGIMSSMQIEGFPATYESVEKSLRELHAHYDTSQMDQLIDLINAPGSNRRALILDFVNNIEDKIETSQKDDATRESGV